MARHLPVAGAVLLLVGLLYSNLTGAYFCGFDDFREAHRVAFQYARDPWSMFTTTAFDPFAYRPAAYLQQFAILQLFHFDPLAFRLRNLAMLLVCVAMLYGIVWLLTQSRLLAAGSALLFGIHPLANQVIAVALWSNATAHALGLAAFFLFLYSLRDLARGRQWPLPLAGSFLCLLAAVFTYEPDIVFLGLVWAYVALIYARRSTVQRQFLTALFAGTSLELLVLFGARHLIVKHGTELLPLGTVARNALLYIAGLATPVDFVLSNALFGTPLPSNMVLTSKLLLGVLIAGAVFLGVIVALARTAELHRRLARLDVGLVGFLCAAIGISILPLLLFKPHASEQNLYLPVAFYVILIGVLCRQLTGSKTIYVSMVAALALFSVPATWVRNTNVVACGAIAHRILSQLPTAQWRHGRWHIRMATLPSERLENPYGIYGHAGLDTIEIEGSKIPGTQYAVQLATGNDRVDVDFLDPVEMAGKCHAPMTCFFISKAGEVTGVSERISQQLR